MVKICLSAGWDSVPDLAPIDGGDADLIWFAIFTTIDNYSEKSPIAVDLTGRRMRSAGATSQLSIGQNFAGRRAGAATKVTGS